MRTRELKIPDVFLVENVTHSDNRGELAVVWDKFLSCSAGPDFSPTSALLSYNTQSGTLRGLHYQQTPHDQSKLVACASGKIWDVIVDLRRNSNTYMAWLAIELSYDSGESVFIPPGCAHGFITLEDNTTVSYLIEGEYIATAAKAIRWDDPQLAINWPVHDPILSERDSSAPYLSQL